MPDRACQDPHKVFFSLLIGTINRPELLQACLHSLVLQTYQNFEVIVIDQSEHNDTQTIVAAFQDERIHYRKAIYSSISRARNDALHLAQGNCVCLMDDDATYESNYLQIAADYIQKLGSQAILSGCIWSPDQTTPFIDYSAVKHMESLSVHQVIRTCPAAALILPMDVFAHCGDFDVDLGVGVDYSSFEETDLLLRAMAKGYRVIHVNTLRVYHPLSRGSEELDKIYRYAVGAGAGCMKQWLVYGSLSPMLYLVTRNIIGQIIHILSPLRAGERAQHIARLKGSLKGARLYWKQKHR